MPEGDTIHKVAARMRPALVGRALTGLWLRERGELPAFRGAVVEEVVELGKHLLIALGRRHVFHGHLGLDGRWIRVAPGERPRSAIAALETAADGFACVRAPVAEVLARISLASHPVIARLGPDLLADEVDFARVLARARRSEAYEIADLLLDQRVACGIGNVYKSEVLFLERVHPWTRASALPDATIESLFRRARERMQWNLASVPRTTVARRREGDPWPHEAPRYFVYGRDGAPCLRCRAKIEARRQGDAARTTWWCPRCQTPASS